MSVGTRYTRKQRAEQSGQAAAGVQAFAVRPTPADFTREAPFVAPDPLPPPKTPTLNSKPMDPATINLTDGGCYLVVEWHKEFTRGVKEIHSIGENLSSHMITSGIAYAMVQMRIYEVGHIQELYDRNAEMAAHILKLQEDLEKALRELNGGTA